MWVYLLAKSLHCSGIFAAVAAGVTMSVTDFWQWRATTRLRKTAAWDTLQFAANGSIFVLMGEQIPVLVSAAPLTVQSTRHQNPWWQVANWEEAARRFERSDQSAEQVSESEGGAPRAVPA
ncbi:MAG TPA: cation:proton antiporter [Burkholderiales bacterium]|nr:cation:proton antiporter [Burkholderiales bacterium]